MKQLKLFLACLGRNTVNFPGTTPPLGILQLAAYIRNKFDADVCVVDQRAENCSLAEVARRAIKFEADVVGIGVLTSYAYMLQPLTQAIRDGLPDALIVLGGPHISSFGRASLEGNVADAAVRGEGERPLEELIAAHRAQTDFSHIPGLMWRDGSGEIIVNEGHLPFIEYLDSLPFPAYDLLDMRKYWKDISFGMLPPHRYMSVFSSRGCPRQCIFCHHIFTKRFRAFSAERVVAELKYYVDTFGIGEIEFLDDAFNHDADRVMKIVELSAKENLKLKLGFPNGLQCQTLTDGLLDALSDMGLYYTSLALESGSPRIQKRIGKHLSIPKFLWSVEATKSRGIFTNGFTMLGFPTETEEDMQATIDVACQSKLDTASFFTVVPYPDTPLHNELLKTHAQKLSEVHYADTDYTGVTVNFSDVPDRTLFAFQRKGWRRFYLNPRRLGYIIRDYPDPWFLPKLLPMFLLRSTKGLFKG